MKLLKMIMFCLILLFCHSIKAQVQQDSLNVIEIVDQYNSAWYNGDSLKMSQVLHPELAKRSIQNFKDTGNDIVSNLSFNMMMQYTTAAYGRNTPKEKQNDKVFVLDVYNDISSVKIETFDYIEYLQLAKVNGEWRIINILWTMKAK